MLNLLVAMADEYGVSTTVIQEFYFINNGSPYSCILGRHMAYEIIVIPSTFHQSLLFLDENWKVGRARGS